MSVWVLTTCHTQYTSDSSICVFLFSRTTLPVFVTCLTGALYVHRLWFYRVIRNDCLSFNNLSYTIHLREQYMYFLFNRTTLQVFVTYITDALYVLRLWFYKHQHDNRVRSAFQRWWYQWRFWFVPSVPWYTRTLSLETVHTTLEWNWQRAVVSRIWCGIPAGQLYLYKHFEWPCTYLSLNNTWMDRQQQNFNTYRPNTEHCGRNWELVETNFVSSTKPNFGNANCSDDQTRVFSTRPVSGPG